MDTTKKPSANENAVTLDGVRINFPYRPYGPQIQIMRTVLKAAKLKQNALIDSPTGTGKTLALLCPLIAWQQQEREHEREQPRNVAQPLSEPVTGGKGEPEASHSTIKSGSVIYGRAKTAKVDVDCECKSPADATAVEYDSCSQAKAEEQCGKKLCQFDGNDDSDVELLEEPPEPKANKGASQPSSTMQEAGAESDRERELRREMRQQEQRAAEEKMQRAFGVTRDRLAASAKRNRADSRSRSRAKARRGERAEMASQFDFENAAVTKLNMSKPVQKSNDGLFAASNQASDGQWKSKAKGEPAFEVPTGYPNVNQNAKNAKPRLMRIVYATRTHKQIKHVIHELKKTVYRRVKMSILGSREYYCVNPLVVRTSDKVGACLDLQKGRGLVHVLGDQSRPSESRERTGTEQQDLREHDGSSAASKGRESEDLLANARQCPHHIMTRNFADTRSLKRVHIDAAWDIEEIVDALRNQRACPYYVSKQLAEEADVIFCPYNYLLDPSIRDAMQVDDLIRNAVVVFDEAHNIEQSARDGASYEADSAWMTDCLVHIDSCMMASKRQLNELSQDNEQHYVALQDFIKQLAAVTIKLGESLTFESNVREDYTVKAGRDVLAILRDLGIDDEAKINALDTHVGAVADTDRDDGSGKAAGLREVHLATLHVHRLRSLLRVAKFVLEHLDDYRLAVIRTRTMQTEATSRRSGGRSSASQVNSSQSTLTGVWLNSRASNTFSSMPQSQHDGVQIVTSIKFWCLSPSIAFSSFSKTVRSVILASGTLSPTISFASELDAVFPNAIETAHVVPTSNTFCAALTKGPKGSSLKFVHRTNEDLNLQDELGESIVSLCRTVPFGVLCFLPSYAVLDKLITRWRSNSIWRRIQTTKYVFVESRFERKSAPAARKSKAHNSRRNTAASFDDDDNEADAAVGLDGFYQRIAELEAELYAGFDGNDSGAQNAFEWNSRRLERSIPNGALLFAVCRGRVSEGLDFTDNQARAVITIGIPYPNFGTPEVKLKMEYNDSRRRTQPATLSNATCTTSKPGVANGNNGNANAFLTGNEWYTIEAFRALNQALGRCIRHRNDWGIILLIDERFGASESHTNSNLSCWLRQRVRPFSQFKELEESVSTFLRGQSLTPSRPVVPRAPKDDLDINLNQAFAPKTDVKSHEVKQGLVVAPSMNPVEKKYLTVAKPGTNFTRSTFSQIAKDLSRSKSKTDVLAQSTQVTDASLPGTASETRTIATSQSMDLKPLSPIRATEETNYASSPYF